MVHACQKSGKCASPEISKIAGSISSKDAEGFARTKHEGLPERKEPKKKKKKKKHLKSYVEYQEQVFIETLNTTGRQMAGMTMGADPNQIRQLTQAAGIDTNKPFRMMMKWLADIEAKLSKTGALNPQSGEEASNNFHQQAVQVLQTVLLQAGGGKRQWQMRQNQRNMEQANKAQNNNQNNQNHHNVLQHLGQNQQNVQQPAPQQGVAQQGNVQQ